MAVKFALMRACEWWTPLDGESGQFSLENGALYLCPNLSEVRKNHLAFGFTRLVESRLPEHERQLMRTEFHGWRNPRKGFHWINIVDRLDRAWLWFCENASRFLRRKEQRQELERDLDSIRNIKFKSDQHEQPKEAETK